jgi:hypothetical protein
MDEIAGQLGAACDVMMKCTDSLRTFGRHLEPIWAFHDILPYLCKLTMTMHVTVAHKTVDAARL